MADVLAEAGDDHGQGVLGEDAAPVALEDLAFPNVVRDGLVLESRG